MKKVIFLICIVGCLQCTSAQKVLKKSFLSTAISVLQFDVEKCFEIEMRTDAIDEMIIEAQIDGEYENDLLIRISEVGSTLHVTAGFRPNFKNPNDKLSAHKVISIALKVTLPEQRKVEVFGTSCNVSVTGLYKYLKVSLSDGRCSLTEVVGATEVLTQSGTIDVQSAKAHITAKSDYGEVIGAASSQGDYSYTLSTVTGNVLLNRVE